MNAFIFLHRKSMHHPHIFKSFVHNKLNLLRINCSENDDYECEKVLFKTRLTHRGYPTSEINELFAHNPSRQKLIYPYPPAEKIPLPPRDHIDSATHLLHSLILSTNPASLTAMLDESDSTAAHVLITHLIQTPLNTTHPLLHLVPEALHISVITSLIHYNTQCPLISKHSPYPQHVKISSVFSDVITTFATPYTQTTRRMSMGQVLNPGIALADDKAPFVWGARGRPMLAHQVLPNLQRQFLAAAKKRQRPLPELTVRRVKVALESGASSASLCDHNTTCNTAQHEAHWKHNTRETAHYNTCLTDVSADMADYEMHGVRHMDVSDEKHADIADYDIYGVKHMTDWDAHHHNNTIDLPVVHAFPMSSADHFTTPIVKKFGKFKMHK